MLTQDTDVEYWTGHNVTNHCQFTTIEASLHFLKWRNAQYVNYDRLMQVSGFDNQIILDYGCGPGHDLIGLGLQSHPI